MKVVLLCKLSLNVAFDTAINFAIVKSEQTNEFQREILINRNDKLIIYLFYHSETVQQKLDEELRPKNIVVSRSQTYHRFRTEPLSIFVAHLPINYY
jgi:hypothetical protein